MGMTYIHATNIHQGGGRTLLSALLRVIKGKVILSADKRMPIPSDISESVCVRRVKPSILLRFISEIRLYIETHSEDIVLCFGNLPPLFRLRAHTIVFIQNRYLLEDIPLNGFSFKIRLRLRVERLFFSNRMANTDLYLVQTPTMKRLLETKLRKKVPVMILPFVAEHGGYSRSILQRDIIRTVSFDFVYVASGEPHKNHIRLIEAWCLLADEGLFPMLCLTLDCKRFTKLCRLISEARKTRGVKIINFGELSHHDVSELYKNSCAAIYPSKFESFGLPLVEARQANLPILASELDYVRDLIDPEQVFDPDSAISIARAVKRFKGVDEKTLPLVDAVEFAVLIRSTGQL
jgi:glycosyltransferase involved in cell wall biosynthesis